MRWVVSPQICVHACCICVDFAAIADLLEFCASDIRGLLRHEKNVVEVDVTQGGATKGAVSVSAFPLSPATQHGACPLSTAAGPVAHDPSCRSDAPSPSLAHAGFLASIFIYSPAQYGDRAAVPGPGRMLRALLLGQGCHCPCTYVAAACRSPACRVYGPCWC
jgi:hypothetical protein